MIDPIDHSRLVKAGSDDWQLNDKRSKLTFFGIYPYVPVMCFHNI